MSKKKTTEEIDLDSPKPKQTKKTAENSSGDTATTRKVTVTASKEKPATGELSTNVDDTLALIVGLLDDWLEANKGYMDAAHVISLYRAGELLRSYQANGGNK